ncbi:hypothetical protein ZWY2020_020743 [Hordeum vulgare]|nr:hypothetical protein ZWY2020_020743 [Hordeum vulgare]
MAFATMPAMSVLDLSNNLLCGEIPISLGSSPALEMLSVVHNNLTGPARPTGCRGRSTRTTLPEPASAAAAHCTPVLRWLRLPYTSADAGTTSPGG